MITKEKENGKKLGILLVVYAVLGLVFFIFSIDLVTFSLAKLNSAVANNIFMATNNPFVGLFIGILITALIQSSSTVTAMVVAVVASGSISLAQAVPLIMGANIGTTLTSSLVSLSYITQNKTFKKAISAAVLHDFFNIITTIVLFPLEVYFGFLSKLSNFLAKPFLLDSWEPDTNGSADRFFITSLTEAISNWFDYPIFWLGIGLALLFLSIKMLSRLAYESLISPKYKKLSKHIFKKPYRAFGYGVFSTALVQSSTITTSLVVTIVATGKASVNKVFPFIMGANIGTTATAVVAALYKNEAAISVAVVHILFNVIGAIIFLPFPSIRKIPIQMAVFFGDQVSKSRMIGLAYILLTFFIIPFFLIYFNRD